MNLAGQDHRSADGYAMAALLVGLTIMSVLLTALLPVWSRQEKREREAELIWRGQQYARAIGLFQRKYANALPPSLDILVEQKFLRKKYRDPMTKDGEFQVLYQGLSTQAGLGAGGVSAGRPGEIAASSPAQPASQVGSPFSQAGAVSGEQAGARGGIMGVASKSTATSIKLFNGRNKYNEWAFVNTPMTTRAGVGGVPSGLPGQVGPGQPGAKPGQGPGARPGFPGGGFGFPGGVRQPGTGSPPPFPSRPGPPGGPPPQ